MDFIIIIKVLVLVNYNKPVYIALFELISSWNHVFCIVPITYK